MVHFGHTLGVKPPVLNWSIQISKVNPFTPIGYFLLVCCAWWKYKMFGGVFDLQVAMVFYKESKKRVFIEKR